jgi:phosphoribosylformylglycinamidine synthase
MVMASNIGASIHDVSGDIALLRWAYGEDQARYLVTTKKGSEIISRCTAENVQVLELGMTGGIDLSFADESITIAELKEAHESWLPKYMTVIN